MSNEDILIKIKGILMENEIYNSFVIDYNIPNSNPSDYNLEEYLTEKIKNSRIYPTNLGSNFLITTPTTINIIKLKDIIVTYKSEIILLIIDLTNGKIEYENIKPKTTVLFLNDFKFRIKS